MLSTAFWLRIGTGFLESRNEFYLVLSIIFPIILVYAIVQGYRVVNFLIVALIAFIIKYGTLPYLPNHIVLSLLVNLLLIFGLFGWLIKDKRHLNLDVGTMWERITPIIRVMVLVMYFFVVFHKLNWDFFSLEYSCGTVLYTEMVESLGISFKGDIINWLVIVLTLALELMIPILLVIPRTFRYGLVIGLTFHFLLALHPNPMILSFTFELCALYVVFMPKKMINAIIAFIDSTIEKLKTNSIRIRVLFILFAVLFFELLFWVIFLDASLKDRHTYKSIFVFNHWLILLALIGLSIYYFRKIPRKYSLKLWPKPSVLLLPLVLLILNGIAPYLNIKTATTFSMFSNLKVDGTSTNHILVRQTVPLLNHLNETAKIIKTNYPPLEEVKNDNERILLFELQRILDNYNSDQEYTIDYSYNNELYSLNLPGDTQLPNYPHIPSWQKKLLIYRNIPMGEHCTCQW